MQLKPANISVLQYYYLQIDNVSHSVLLGSQATAKFIKFTKEWKIFHCEIFHLGGPKQILCKSKAK